MGGATFLITLLLMFMILQNLLRRALAASLTKMKVGTTLPRVKAWIQVPSWRGSLTADLGFVFKFAYENHKLTGHNKTLRVA